MKKFPMFSGVLGVTAALFLVGAPAANAAPPTAPPPGQTLYAIDCDTHGSLLWSFTPDGAATPIGTNSDDTKCAGGGQTSQIDGKTYFVYYPGGPISALATIDLATGAITTIANITGATTGAWQLFITNSGAAYIVQANVLYSIDLTTAVTTLIGPMTGVITGTVGYDALTDTIYAFNISNTIGIFTIDRTTGAATNTGLGGNWPVANCLGGGTDAINPDGVAFDSAGFAWIQSDSCDSNIVGVDMSNGSSAVTGELFDSTAVLYPTAPHDFYSETFLIGPVPQVAPPAPDPGPSLAATGVDGTPLAIAGGIAALTALLGAALVARRRRTV